MHYTDIQSLNLQRKGAMRGLGVASLQKTNESQRRQTNLVRLEPFHAWPEEREAWGVTNRLPGQTSTHLVFLH